MAKISPPWVTFYRKVEALFGDDPQVRVVFEEETYTLRLHVESAVKAEAIEAILPAEKTFGNVTVRIVVIPANENRDRADLIRTAFEGNPALAFVRHVDSPLTGDIVYAVFDKRVVQFFNDDLSDLNGNCSTLFQEIAKDVLDAGPGTFYCTAPGNTLGR